VPDYVSLTYDFVVWTSYTEQMNKIIEKIIWSEGAYWGEDGKFKFRTSIDSYTDASELSVNSERLIKTNFTVTLKGYLIPEEFNNVVTTQKHLTPKRILIGDDVSVNLTKLVGDSQTKDVKISASCLFSSSVRVLLNASSFNSPFFLSRSTLKPSRRSRCFLSVFVLSF